MSHREMMVTAKNEAQMPDIQNELVQCKSTLQILIWDHMSQRSGELWCCIQNSSVFDEINITAASCFSSTHSTVLL